MEYEKQNNGILIKNNKYFNPQHILKCGQIFRFTEQKDGSFVVYSKDMFAIIKSIEDGFFIETKNVDYFEEFFDLKTDYEKIEKRISNTEIVCKAVGFGRGLRLIKNDFYEIIFSFVISANNNISRIKKIIEKLCVGAGSKIQEGKFAFPTLEELLNKDLGFFEDLGAGYRGKYLFKLSRQLKDFDIKCFDGLSTREARKILISFAGVGPKVADCILLFALNRKDVFPVDTWIESVYHKYFESGLKNRVKIADFLVEKFGEDSGYVQQFLFYAQREIGKADIV